MNAQAKADEPTTGVLLPAADVVTTALANFDPFDAQLEEFRTQYAGVVYDMDDPAQNARARSDKRAIGKVVASLDRTHATVKAPLLEATRQLDGRRKALKDEFVEIQGNSKGQIAEHEQREADRVAALDNRVQELRELARSLPEHGVALEYWQARLATVEAIALDDSWQERKPDAALAKAETVDSIKASIQYTEEQAELVRLREEREARERAEREEQIRVEARAKAELEAEEARKAEAERVEREQREAEERHQQELKAEQDAREKAERDRVAAEERVEREKQEAANRAASAERKRIDDEQDAREKTERDEAEKEHRRQANKKHRATVEQQAVESLLEAMQIDGAVATSVIESIRDGEVANVVMVY